MNKAITDYKSRPEQVELAPRQAITVRAHRGTEVRVVHGEAWITQEGDGEDYIVGTGTRFCSGSDGSIVVSALNEGSRVVVSWTDPAVAGGYARSGVWLDYSHIERLERGARRARADELVRLMRAGIARLIRVWRGITRRRRTPSRLATR